MKGALALFLHSAKRHLSLLMAIAALLFGFQLLLIFGARSLQELNTFSQLASLVPEFLRQILGPSLLTLLSFRGIACLGFFHVAVLAMLVGLAISIGTEPAGEVESRFCDLILAHPLARHWVVTRSIALLAASIFVLLGAMTLGTRLGLGWLVSGELSAKTFESVPGLALNLAALLFCWGGVALALASVAKRRAAASAGTALLAAGLYMLDLIAQVWKPLQRVARYSPFHYYRSLNLVTGNPDHGHDILILASAAIVALALAYFFFSRRDL